MTFQAREEIRAKLFGHVWRDLIPEVFRDVPKYYDRGNQFASLGLCAWWSDKFVASMRFGQNAKVLDVCSGTHDIPLRMLARDPSTRIFAIDRSSHMMMEGQRRAQARQQHIEATVHDAHSLPWKDAEFDAVTLQFATRHLRVTEVFREIYRVLKLGATFYHNDMLRPASKWVEVPYLLYLRFFVWLTSVFFRSSRESKDCIRYFADAIRHFYTPEEMSQLLREIGFVEVEHKAFLTGALAFHSARKPL